MSKLKKAIQKAEQARGEGWTGLDARAWDPDRNRLPEVPPPATEQETTPQSDEIVPRQDVAVGNALRQFAGNGGSEDAVRSLRAQLMRRLGEPEGCSVLVTSARAGEGKTYTAVRLALNLAVEAGQPVLLVDANLRGRSIHETLGLNGAPGLGAVLQGRNALGEAVVDPAIPNLAFLPAGPRVDEAGKVLGSSSVNRFVEQLRAECPAALILVDGPPALEFSDALLLAGKVDGVLLVVEAERTAARDVTSAVETLRGHHLLGVVYNNWRG